MSLFENIKMALEGLKLNKMRSFLTMLGIIIGIASVIAILTIGQAMTKTVSDGFNSINRNMIQLSVEAKKGYDWIDISARDYYNDDDLNNIRERFKDRVKYVIIQGNSKTGKIKKDSGNGDINVSVTPTDNGGDTMKNLKFITGRFINKEDVDAVRNVCVISDKVVKENFGGDYSAALGSEIEVDISGGIYAYKCIGVYKYEKSQLESMAGMGQNTDSTELYIPYTVGIKDFEGGENEGYAYAIITTYNAEQVQSVSTDIQDYLNKSKFAESEIAEAEATTLESQISQITSVMSNVQLAIGGIAAISLLVGGIGVMNILLVSVTERTREIGVRKALGATSMDIRGQFITESIIICIIGGIIGVILGGSLGYFASGLMQMPTLPNLFSILLAVGFSMSIGIFFGYYPANKAAKLNPIDALRYE